MFESIIRHFIDRNEIHARDVYELRRFVAYLESQTEHTKQQLLKVLSTANHRTVVRDKTGRYPSLEFWRDMEGYSSILYMEFGENGFTTDDLSPIVKDNFYYRGASDAERIKFERARNEIKIDTNKFPVSQLFCSGRDIGQQSLFYTWIAHLWQEVEGHQCGLSVLTVQNNSIARFSLNDFLDEFSSSYIQDTGEFLSHVIQPLFNRKLSVLELFMRASQTGYPFNPYCNYWRYFEKGNEFCEIVTYEFATGFRTGSTTDFQTPKVNNIIQHDDPKSALLYLSDFTNKAINDGWEENFRPTEMPERMHDKAYNIGFWTGVAWHTNGKEKENRLKLQDILKFEMAHGIQLPDVLALYLRLFNGRQYNKHYLNFPIDDLYMVTVKQFYTLNELNTSASITLKENPNILWIGVLSDDALLGVCIQQDDKQNYGKVAVNTDGSISICEYSFELFVRYAQGGYSIPEIVAAQENDIEFLKKRLDEGWNHDTEMHYGGTALRGAAEFNAHDTLALLLERGAKMKRNKANEHRQTYDAKTIELLDRYLVS